MVTKYVLPDLLERSGERAVIVSRSLKTWGTSESGLAEMIAERVDQQTNPTIAFLARGIEGIYVRMTAKAPTEDEARDAPRRRRRRAAQGARRARVRGRRRHDGVGGAAPLRGARVVARRRRVAHRRVHRRAPRQRARREPHVPRLDRVVRHRGEALGARCHRRAGGHRGGGEADGRGRAARARRRRRASRSPASPGPTSRTASRSAPSGTASPSPATSPRRSPPGCRSTASASASSPPSRCSTCCGCGCSHLDEVVVGLARSPAAFLAVVPPPAARAWTESAQNSAAAVGARPAVDAAPSNGTSPCSSSARCPTPTRSAEFVAESVRPREPFTLSLGGGGAFPTARRASVLWLGVREGEDALAELAAPFADDDRPFRAHLTLARVRPGTQTSRTWSSPRSTRAVRVEPWTVDEVVLFESDDTIPLARCTPRVRASDWLG